jgi:phosphoribosylamine--glycine ligase
VTNDRDEALAHAAECGRVVIEEFLDGPEVSLFAVCDGATAYPLQPAQDFKRIFDGDEGRTPAAWAPTARCRGRPADLVDEVIAHRLQPTSTRWPAAARRSAAACTPASR